MFRFKPDKAAIKAVAYYRHSAEDKQEFSIPLQRERTEKFAAENKIEIIHEESDDGVSGLTAKRPGFQRLLDQWITNPNAPAFDCVLTLDVTRWGRFQDLNEPAHYEYLCTNHGKDLIYVTRGMPEKNDRLASSVVTMVERFEASRFSERLSEKVSYGSLNIAKQGYSVGGTACYGLTRLLLDETKQPKGILKKGQHKSIANERVTFTPANDETTEVVKDIFKRFVNNWETPLNIATAFNQSKIPSPSGKTWKTSSILRILSNETYIGTRIYNRTWNKLKKGHRRNPKSEWVIVPDAFPAIIEKAVFDRAQERSYWLMPTYWKRGIYAVRRAQRLIQKELRKLLLDKGAHEDDVFTALQELPVLYGVSSQELHSSVARWCFLIPNEMRKHPFILGVGVFLSHNDIIDRTFLVPTQEFGYGNFRMFSEKDNEYSKYYLKDEDLEAKVLKMVKDLGIAVA